MKIDNLSIFQKLSRKFKFDQNTTRVMGTFHEVLSTFVIICCLILVRMRNVLDKSCRENQNTHFIFSNFPPPL